MALLHPSHLGCSGYLPEREVRGRCSGDELPPTALWIAFASARRVAGECVPTDTDRCQVRQLDAPPHELHSHVAHCHAGLHQVHAGEVHRMGHLHGQSVEVRGGHCWPLRTLRGAGPSRLHPLRQDRHPDAEPDGLPVDEHLRRELWQK